MKRPFQLIRDTGIWAPATVLVLHEFLSIPGWRTQIDWFNHFSGGLAFTFFAWKSLPLIYPWTGQLTFPGRLGAAFLAGCTAALLWDIGEFSSDLMFGTNIQKSLHETMMDLMNGFLGTTTTVALLAFLTSKHPTAQP
ncbi:MAG: hypothetical protein EOP87_26425 [Verrucomicrobiaceae bacterium]|nr:MAG: hypothetical protein EOP87_26425 [Verrucomicrobiaceae bacterium]